MGQGGGCWGGGLEEEEGAGSLSAQQGRGEGWKGSGRRAGSPWQSGGDGGDGELPLSHESGFSDGNGGVSSSPWTMAPFALLPAATKNRGDGA